MYEESTSSSPLIRLLWRAAGTSDGAVTDAATEYWGVTFPSRADGRSLATIAGPSLEPRPMDWLAGDEYWGVELEPHVMWRGLGKGDLLGRLVDISADEGWCEIGGVRIAVPTFAGLESFVDRLAAQGVLIHDEAVAAALAGRSPFLSGRTMQRRFRVSTGLGRKQIEQLERARQPFALLQKGHRPAEVAALAGYSDQSRLTRSLTLLAGRTPAQILGAVRKVQATNG